MAKIYGLQGAMTGKLANTVMVVRNGEQIARKYQPIVTNPQTTRQVEARSKLKFMSQLAAVYAPFIAMPRQGVISSRNRFTKVNYKSLVYSEGTTTLPMQDIKLTDSSVFLPAPTITPDGTNFNVAVAAGNLPVDRVVIVLARVVGDDGEIRIVDSKVVNEKVEGAFTASFGAGGGYQAIVLAYGIRDNNDRARAAYGDLEAVSATSIARLITTRVLTEADVTLTETVGVVGNTTQA